MGFGYGVASMRWRAACRKGAGWQWAHRQAGAPCPTALDHPSGCLLARRWDRSCTASDIWAGRGLKPVQIEMRGRFKYCVLRIR